MRQDHFISSSLPNAHNRPGLRRHQPTGPSRTTFRSHLNLSLWQGTIMFTECAATKRTGYWEYAARAREFCESVEQLRKTSNEVEAFIQPLTRPDGFTAGAHSRASKWISTFPSTAASGGGPPFRH